MIIFGIVLSGAYVHQRTLITKPSPTDWKSFCVCVGGGGGGGALSAAVFREMALSYLACWQAENCYTDLRQISVVGH